MFLRLLCRLPFRLASVAVNEWVPCLPPTVVATVIGLVRLVVSGVVATAVTAVAAVSGAVSAVIAAVSAVSGVAAVTVSSAVLIAVLRRIGCGLLGVLFGLRRLLILPCLGLLRAGAHVPSGPPILPLSVGSVKVITS